MKSALFLCLSLMIGRPLTCHGNPPGVPNNFDDGESMLQTFQRNVINTWTSSDTTEAVLPVALWHNRLAYDEENLHRFTEHPIGGGIARSRIDEKGDWNSLYFIVFQDSYDKPETFGGYAWETIWKSRSGLRFGLGITAAVTARDNYDYVPLPVVLPLASLGYGLVTLQATYIPGTYNNGNVLFAWIRFVAQRE